MEQRSKEWYELRRTKIGASDCPALMGISPWKNSYDVWLSKQPDYSQEVNEAMQRGIDLEPYALMAFEQETGYLMSPQVIISDQTSFMMASLDGYEIDGKCAVEIKCPFTDKTHIKSIEGHIPEYYIGQMQHQMYVAELDQIYYCSYRPEHVVNPLYIEVIKRDESFISEMIKKEENFYFGHMITKIPPEHPKKIKKIENNDWIAISQEYKRHDREIKILEKRKQELRDSLVQIAQSENACGNGIILQKIERNGIIPYANIPEVKQMDLEKYRKSSTSFWQVKESNCGMY